MGDAIDTKNRCFIIHEQDKGQLEFYPIDDKKAFLDRVMELAGPKGIHPDGKKLLGRLVDNDLSCFSKGSLPGVQIPLTHTTRLPVFLGHVGKPL